MTEARRVRGTDGAPCWSCTFAVMSEEEKPSPVVWEEIAMMWPWEKTVPSSRTGALYRAVVPGGYLVACKMTGADRSYGLTFVPGDNWNVQVVAHGKRND